ncbi:hypothetical protein AMTRI_Chr02g257790 [Amborella trichopoda]
MISSRYKITMLGKHKQLVPFELKDIGNGIKRVSTCNYWRKLQESQQSKLNKSKGKREMQPTINSIDGTLQRGGPRNTDFHGKHNTRIEHWGVCPSKTTIKGYKKRVGCQSLLVIFTLFNCTIKVYFCIFD